MTTLVYWFASNAPMYKHCYYTNARTMQTYWCKHINGCNAEILLNRINVPKIVTIPMHQPNMIVALV